MYSVNDLLRMAAEMKASDLHLTVGVPPKVRVFGELRDIGYKAMPDGWWPRFVVSTFSMGYSVKMPYPYFLQDGIVDELPIVPYLTWSPSHLDKNPWVRVELGGKKKFSKVVLHRCRDKEGRIAPKSGRVVADGREVAAFGVGGCKVEIGFPVVEADSVTVEVGETDASAKCRLLSEVEVY